LRDQLLAPSYILLLGLVLTIIVALESLYYVPWSPYFLIYAILAIILPVYVKSYKFGPLKLAFSKENIQRFIVFFLTIFIVLYIIEFCYNYILSIYGLYSDTYYNLDRALEALANKAGFKFGISAETAIGIYAIYVIVWAPIGEELFYRGYMFGGLRKKYSFNTSAIVSSLFFGVRHMTHFIFILPLYPLCAAIYWAIHTFIFGLIISHAYEKTDTLYVPILIHFLYNLIDAII